MLEGQGEQALPDFLKGLVQGRLYPADEQLREDNPQLVTDCAAPCMGFSFVNQQTVNTILAGALPITASIALVALVFWVTGGVLFGILAAMTKGSFLDRGLVGLTLIAYAFPSFFIGKFLITYVAIRWALVEYPSAPRPAGRLVLRSLARADLTAPGGCPVLSPQWPGGPVPPSPRRSSRARRPETPPSVTRANRSSPDPSGASAQTNGSAWSMMFATRSGRQRSSRTPKGWR